MELMIHYIQKKKRKFVFSYWYLIFLFHFLFSINASAQTINKDYLDGHIYLKIRNDITINIPSIGEKVNLKDAFFLNDIKKQYQLIRLEKPFFAAKSAALQHTFRLEFSDFENVDKIIEALYKTKIIEYAEKVPLEKFYYTPNDPMYNSGTQWFLNKINAPNAWNLSKGSSQISVAIVDGGVLLTHPDLKANIWINPKEIPNNKIDDDKNGYVDDVNGYDVSDNDADPTNGYGAPHGTHCAGLASAVTDNNSGIASIGFGIKIMAVKVSKNATPTQPFNSPNGVLYAIEAGARVISISLGGVTYSATYQNIFNYAHDRGVVVVAAAGNDNTNAKHYPGAYNHVICIGATDQNDKRASFSDYGTWVDVMAPGVAMNSTVPTESNPTGFGLFDGTSMACPLTAGLCGLMLSVFPDATPEQVESCLKSSAINVDNLNSGYAGQLGAGRIDASAALQCMGLLSKMTPTAAFTANNTTTCPGATIYFSDQSTFKPGSWLWDFGDGTTSSLQNPTHTYASQGTYTVKLTATNSNGPGVATKTNYITVGAGVPNSNTQKTGPADSTKGNGRGFSSAGLRAMYFKVDKELTLKSIRVYTGDTAGNRRFVIIDTALLSAFSITEYYDTTINLPANKDLRINFNNWHLNPGTYCLLLDIARNGLVQNLLRTTGGISYPQAIPGVISIFSNWFALNNNSTPQEWYVGYDWEILVNECVTSVGLPEISLIQNLNIYPNPGNGHFTITFNAPEKSDYLIEIRNVLGQVISNEKLLDIAGEYNRELDLSQLGKGIYFFTLKSGYNHTIQKLIIE